MSFNPGGTNCIRNPGRRTISGSEPEMWISIDSCNTWDQTNPQRPAAFCSFQTSVTLSSEIIFELPSSQDFTWWPPSLEMDGCMQGFPTPPLSIVGQNNFMLISSTWWQILSLLNVIFKSLYTALSSSPLCWKSVLGDTTVFWNFISMICCIPNPWPGLLRTMHPCLHFPGCFFISLGFSLLPLWT